ncbi:Tim10/DDP zinc finger domain-containing protein [Cryptosporidium muris RN66]|uniref:Mitochondrial import inner membrane translocase subunit n=1 Tax=Cryptosporidium muris (strain RN66) TaxID=441375 RepID=B6AJ50_CRYMR|nr:Tim10/DDP zinc finger domain-containing protein [Cryptosporidium muris RN66]EEA08287.1 Tim10/DDP zinc finger domain-containing protein [Cryptosporidium muris RN66]|eukprot:XP_002142636.1 Tim10/DDP zinc finger domain-containing protein [Cryptosporidium muris RN66]
MNENSESSIQALEKLQVLQKIIESQKIVVKMTSKCFKHCVPNVGKSLSQKEQACLWSCAQRFLESTDFINRRSSENIRNVSNVDSD